MNKIAILIAVEKYVDPDFAAVAYARKDARTLSKVLELHGFEKADQLLLVDRHATKAAIESKVKPAIQRLQKGDSLCFFYAGRGFAQAGQSYLTCHDTQSSSAAATSVALGSLFKELPTSQCERVVLLLDSGPGGNGWNEDELDQIVQDAGNCVCLTACKSDESSYPSNRLKHGIWAYHLIEALNGDAPRALEKGLLTASSLQQHLLAEVPRTLRTTFSGSQEQTPTMFGALPSDVSLADLRPILRERQEAANNGNGVITQLSFVAHQAGGVKSLSGWKKSYRIPDSANDSANSFVVRMSASELKEDLDSVYAALKRAFSFTRRDLDAAEPADGTGTIITPYFNYSVSLALNPADPSELIWTRTVDGIKDPDQVASDAFGTVFDNKFDTLELSLPEQLNLEVFIDALESADLAGVEIRYDRDLTHCDLKIKGTLGAVRLTSKTLSIVHNRPQATRLLIQSFDSVRSLVHKYNVRLV